MKYLLDTHIIMWALINDPKLDRKIKKIILNDNNAIYYSTASVWEVEIKHLSNKNFKLSGEQLSFLCDQNGLLNIPILNKHIEELENLKDSKETNHNDPFDKLLLAQARKEDMIFITHDKKFKKYEDKNIMVC